jgi:PTH1 family peptidyl-tRNA hydrolase
VRRIDIMKKMFVGLGNPDYEYKTTRHNVGFMFIDRLAKKLGISMKYKKSINAMIGDNESFILMKPQTYMNSSGVSIRKFLSNTNLRLEDVYIVHDDINLALGKSRCKNSGSSHGGHNGIKSVIKETGSKDTKRIKIGIGKQKEGETLLQHVLDKFTKKELEIIIPIIDNYIEDILKGELYV